VDEIADWPWPKIEEWAAEFAIRAEDQHESPEVRLAREASAKIKQRRGAASR
jgi:hypothetical protein